MGRSKKKKSTPTSPPSPSRRPHAVRLLVIVSLLALFALVAGLKIRNTTSLSYYNPVDDTNFYWTESAFHYRHFLMVSSGESIPAVDVPIQYPDGLDIRHYVTPVMEQVYGRIHRWFFADVPPHHFLVHATAIFSTLSVLAVFFAARALTRNRGMPLLAAAAYGLALGSMYRNTSGFVREDFALPLIFGSFACYLHCLRDDRWSVAAVGAALLALALAAWHVSQFYYQLFVIGVALTALVHGVESLPRRCFSALGATAIACSLLYPVLRAKFFALAMPMMITYGLLLFIWINPAARGWSYRQATRRLAGALCALVAAALIAQTMTASHSHVFAVLLAKLRHFGILPDDPQALSFEAKVMWTSAFVHLSWDEVKLLFASTLVLGGWGLVALLRSGSARISPGATLLVYFAVVTLALAILFNRLTVLAVFFLPLLVVFAWPIRQTWLRYVFGLVVVGCLYFELAKFFGWGNIDRVRAEPTRPAPQILTRLTNYLQSETPPQAAVLTSFQLSPSIAAFANRPVLIQPKFESRGLRDKVELLYTGLFGPEAEFYELCKRFDARYLVLRSSMATRAGPRSLAYIVGYQAIPTASVAFACHFAPDTLQHFRLVQQSPAFRVFEIVDQRPSDELQPPYMALYDRHAFFAGELGPTISASELDAGRERLRRLAQLVQSGRSLTKSGKLEEARARYQEALEMHEAYPPALLGMVDVYSRLGRYEAAGANLAAAMRVDRRHAPPAKAGHPLPVAYALAMAHWQLREWEVAETLMRDIVRQRPKMWQPRLHWGLILVSREAYQEAADVLREALAINPQAVPVLNALAQCHLKLGQRAEATAVLKRSLQLDPGQPKIEQALRQFLVCVSPATTSNLSSVCMLYLCGIVSLCSTSSPFSRAKRCVEMDTVFMPITAPGVYLSNIIS